MFAKHCGGGGGGVLMKNKLAHCDLKLQILITNNEIIEFLAILQYLIEKSTISS